jgi:phosphoketolase
MSFFMKPSSVIAYSYSWTRFRLSVRQHFLDNPLLKQPLKREHVKPRLVGHLGITPGLNFIHLRLNRIVKGEDLENDSVLHTAFLRSWRMRPSWSREMFR